MSEPIRSERYDVTLHDGPPLSPSKPARPKPAGPVSTRARAKAQARAAKAPRHARAKSGKSAVKDGGSAAAQVDLVELPDGTGQPDGTGLPEDTRGSEARHLEIVASRSQRRLARRHRARLLVRVAAAGVVVIAFGLVYLRVIAAQRQFTLDHLNTEVTAQEATYERLQLQVAQLNAPDRIVSYAESKLGMFPSNPTTILTPTAGASTPSSSSPTQAPVGDADWPQIKALMAGTP